MPPTNTKDISFPSTKKVTYGFTKHLCNLILRVYYLRLLLLSITLPVRFPAGKKGTFRRGMTDVSFVRGEFKENPLLLWGQVLIIAILSGYPLLHNPICFLFLWDSSFLKSLAFEFSYICLFENLSLSS